MAVRGMTADAVGKVQLSVQISPRLKRRLVLLALQSGQSLTGLTNYALEALATTAEEQHAAEKLRYAQELDAKQSHPETERNRV